MVFQTIREVRIAHELLQWFHYTAQKLKSQQLTPLLTAWVLRCNFSIPIFGYFLQYELGEIKAQVFACFIPVAVTRHSNTPHTFGLVWVNSFVYLWVQLADPFCYTLSWSWNMKHSQDKTKGKITISRCFFEPVFVARNSIIIKWFPKRLHFFVEIQTILSLAHKKLNFWSSWY